MWLAWGLVLGGGLALSYGVLLAQQTATLSQPTGVPGWLSLSGVLAVCGLLVQWGAWRKQIGDTGKAIDKLGDAVAKAMPRVDVESAMHRLEDKVDERFDKLESRLDSLFGLLKVDRRKEDR